jgi:hypothetical protein
MEVDSTIFTLPVTVEEIEVTGFMGYKLTPVAQQPKAAG